MKRIHKISFLLVIALSLLIMSCRAYPGQDLKLQSIKPPDTPNSKPVIIILIDSLMDKPLHEAIKKGSAPALQYLMERGKYYPHMVSSFPTMSVTIDSTMLTGTYADQHHVPGLVWFSGKENRMIFYGNGPKETMKIDQPQVLMDAIYQLNQVQLNKQTKTIHEELAERGKQSASINGIVFRGKTEHSLQLPPLIANTTSLPQQVKVTGPPLLSYAAMAQLDPNNSRNARMWKKYGMNNLFSAHDTAFLIKQKKLPSVTIAYFPENDMAVHRKGISHLGGIEKADQALQVVLNAFGSWDQAIKSAIWIVMGDSAQSAVQDDRQTATVDLRPLLNQYRIARLNQPIGADDQIVISTNERMAYVYAIDDQVPLSDVVKHLQKESKLDLIAIKDGNTVQVTTGKNSRMLSYRPGGNATDEYGQFWTISGDPSLADITVTNNRIKYGKYPDVLARLYGAMNSHEGRFAVVTVQPGYEVVTESSPTHIGGGAHGSLHELDSLVPFLVTGTDTLPKTMRIVDIKDWIVQLVNEKGK
ncbi:alkaline phosphatase family protein [Brevibacillus nitrificans]|uniref:alkaline phosphatase family protein n=1 Tax=Brevibacillus nitrificans TaxID=651560 RepID=UPI00286CD055|nr:alkaline phosphatase family protein [Brevibacillus nitrificans]